MLVIRLTRKGKKNQPFFRVVVTDRQRSSKGGRSLEDLGYVDPLTKRKTLNKERILYWISKGAQPSDTMHNLLVTEKIIEGKKVHVSKISPKKQAEINKAKEEATASAAAKAKADEDAKKAAASQSEASLAPEGAGSEAPKEEPKPKPAVSENSGEPKEEKPEASAQ